MKKKILVVDDSSLARRLTRKMLEELGHEVEEAPGGVQALEQYALGQHDLVVLDMLMSGMYGLEVLQNLKQLNPALPVIVATADIQRTTRDQVKEAGASAMINKPVNPEELAEVVELVLNGGTSWN
jgi:two-component system chemotaxis response regulator CheY